MYQNIHHLLMVRRFLPFFITQFLSAFNDNLFKFALVLFLKYQMTDLTMEETAALTTLAAGLFILPFFLFSATAGQLADKFEKSGLIQIIRFSEIPLMILAAVGFWLESASFLLMVLFLMGSKSAFFGPLKYSILPEQLKKDELIGANGLVEMGTFVSILLGTILGGTLIVGADGRWQVSAMAITLAVLGFAASRFIPRNVAKSPKLKVNINIAGETFHILKEAYQRRAVLISILGISWFWLLGATFLAQFPNFSKDVIFGAESVATLFLFSLSLGIGIGSLLCNKVLKSRISARLSPWAALVIGVFAIDIYFSSQAAVTGEAGALLSLGEFLAYPQNWRVVLDLVMLALAGGFFIVPLYTILQTRSPDKECSRMIAANNVTNAFFMVISALATVGLFRLGFSVLDIFLGLGVVTLAVGVLFYLKRGWEDVE